LWGKEKRKGLRQRAQRNSTEGTEKEKGKSPRAKSARGAPAEDDEVRTARRTRGSLCYVLGVIARVCGVW